MSFGLGRLGASFSKLGAFFGGYPGFVAGNLTTWEAKLAQVQAGTSQAMVLCMGASATRGFGGGTDGSGTTDDEFYAYPKVMADLLNTAGYKFNTLGSVCAGDSGGTDVRVVMGTNWTKTGNASLGGLTFTNQTAGDTTNALSFTPYSGVGTQATFDNIKVWWLRNASRDTGTIEVDGGAALGTFNTAGSAASGVQSTSFTCARGTHTINIRRTNTTTGGLHLVGIETWDSTITRARVFNAGEIGTVTADLVSVANGGTASNNFGSQVALANMAPDLTIVVVGGNDANTSTVIATMQSCLASLITTAGAGKVIVASHTPVNISEATRRTYTNALKATAKAGNATFVDLTALMGSFAAANGAGLMFNNLHPNANGYIVEAGFMKQAVLM